MEILQCRGAASVASLVAYCYSPLFAGKTNPVDKVIKNLFTFLNQDTSTTPVFKPTSDQEGIISLNEDRPPPTTKDRNAVPEESEGQIAMRVTRRGALQAFKCLADEFERDLFDTVPKLWEGISAAVLLYNGELEEADQKILDGSTGQDIIDAMTSLRLIVPSFHPALHARLSTLFRPVIAALSSSHSQIRNTAAKCLAGLCDTLTETGMRQVVDHVVPLVGDAKRVHARQGAAEAIHHILKMLEIKVLPYILFLIVPVLGRMSDPDEPTRLLATSTFAQLIKMVPLEVSWSPDSSSPNLEHKGTGSIADAYRPAYPTHRTSPPSSSPSEMKNAHSSCSCLMETRRSNTRSRSRSRRI